MKKIIALFFLVFFVVITTGCSSHKKDDISLESAVHRNEIFGSATFELTADDFRNAGFSLGDSCDVIFENGLTLRDVPYYNGYYVKNGAPVVVAYPGYPEVSITYNNIGIWEEAGLEDGERVTVILSEKGKYSDVQDVLGQKYSTDREDYSSDREFVNFRALSGGELKDGFLFRGASPVDNVRGRAEYTDRLLAEEGIRFVINLSDTVENYTKYTSEEDFKSPYSASLCEEDSMLFLGLGSAYASDAFRDKIAYAMKELVKSEGPVYIHCVEGKDRTGFVCALIEAFAGASYDEMLADYMITYYNYYKVDKDSTPEKYKAIADLYFDGFMAFLHGTDDEEVLKTADYREDAERYLKDGGMTEEEIKAFRAMISK